MSLYADNEKIFDASEVLEPWVISAGGIYTGTIDGSCFIVQNKVQPTIEYLPKPTNCKNCGAVLHGRKCEYCETEY